MLVAEQGWRHMKSECCEVEQRWDYTDWRLGACDDFVSQWEEFVLGVFGYFEPVNTA